MYMPTVTKECHLKSLNICLFGRTGYTYNSLASPEQDTSSPRLVQGLWHRRKSDITRAPWVFSVAGNSIILAGDWIIHSWNSFGPICRSGGYKIPKRRCDCRSRTITDCPLIAFKATYFVLLDGKRKLVSTGEEIRSGNRLKKKKKLYTLLDKIQAPKPTNSKIYCTFKIYIILSRYQVQGNGKRICTDGTIIWPTYGNKTE